MIERLVKDKTEMFIFQIFFKLFSDKKFKLVHICLVIKLFNIHKYITCMICIELKVSVINNIKTPTRDRMICVFQFHCNNFVNEPLNDMKRTYSDSYHFYSQILKDLYIFLSKHMSSKA